MALATNYRTIILIMNSIKTCIIYHVREARFHLIGTVGKVELITTFTTDVCECWNVSDRQDWGNAGILKQSSMGQTHSEDNRSD